MQPVNKAPSVRIAKFPLEMAGAMPSEQSSLTIRGIHEFVKDLKLNKTFTQKQCTVIENLYIYFEDLMVYKVVIAIHPEMLKKAKKLGMNTNTGYITIYMDNVKLDIRSLLPGVEKGRFIAIYNPNNAECNIYTGEEEPHA